MKKNNNFTKEELEIIMTNNYDCFADCGDGCHALNEKECKGCSFYTPRCQIKDNPFYKYSWIDKDKMKNLTKKLLIKREQIME